MTFFFDLIAGNPAKRDILSTMVYNKYNNKNLHIYLKNLKNFKQKKGICLEKCSNGYTDFLGLLCKKSMMDWHFKKSYAPDVYNFFDSRAKCPFEKIKYFIDSKILCFR